MRGFIFLLLVGLMAHAAFVQPGPVEHAAVTMREVVVVQAVDVAEIDDSWKENVPTELFAIEVVTDNDSEEGTVPDIPPQAEMIAEDAPSEDSIIDAPENAEESDGEEIAVGDPVPIEEQPVEEVYEPTPVIEEPLLVIEEDAASTDTEEVPIEENLVEALQEE